MVVAHRENSLGKRRVGEFGIEAADLKRAATDLARQGVSHLNRVVVAIDIETEVIGDVNRPRGAWFVLQTTQVCLDFASVDLDFRLVGERDVLTSVYVACAEYHHFQCLIDAADSGEDGIVLYTEIYLDRMPMMRHD